MIDLEARSRRNNLIFRGFVENRGENCFTVIQDFLDNRMDIDPRDVYMARAHRLGPKKPGRNFNKRPIIVNFRDYSDIDYILSRTRRLRDSPGLSVDLDFPKEIQ
jgi:hypothetical protein